MEGIDTMNAPAPTRSIRYDGLTPGQLTVAPLLRLPIDRVQAYFQVLWSHDTLRFRFSDCDDPQWDTVVNVIQRHGKGMYLVLDCSGNCVAEFMLENYTGQSAQIHFSTHPELVLADRLKISRWTLGYLLHGWVDPATDRPFLRSVFGVTPMPNRAACLFALKSGFKKLGILPGGCSYFGKTEDAMISVASGEQHGQ